MLLRILMLGLLSLACGRAALADEVVVVGAACTSFGASTMTTDRKDIAVCLEDDSGNPVWKSITNGSGGVPVGAIIAWPAIIDPPDMAKWLECKGQAITRDTYPELFAVVGTRVPDLRGLFLRGLGGNSGALGVAQSDMLKAHQHGYGIAGDVWNNNAGVNAHYSAQVARHSTPKTDMSGDPNVYIETRPVNMAVRYLIRAKN